MSRMHKKRKDKKNTYEMQRALSEMLSAASTVDETGDTNAAPESPDIDGSRDPEQTGTEATDNHTDEQIDTSAIPVPTIPDGAQIGAVEDTEIRTGQIDDGAESIESETADGDSNRETDTVAKTDETGAETGDETAEPTANDDMESTARQAGDDTADIEQEACEGDSDDNPDSTGDVVDTAETSEDNVDDAAADTDAAEEGAAELGDDLTPNEHETLQEQADRIAKEESRRTLESIDSQLDASGDKAIDDFISGKIKEALAERDECRRNGDKRGVERLGKRLNEIAKLRDGDDRTLDGVTAEYDKIMKDEDDRLMLIAKHEAEQEERERVKRVDALAVQLKEMSPNEAKQAIAGIDGNDYMTLAERHAALVSDITSYVEEPEQEQGADETNFDATDGNGIASATDDSAEADTDEVNDAERSGDDTESDGSNGLKEYYDRYGGEPSQNDIGVIRNKPHEQSEKAKRRQERRQREKERQALLAKRAEERAEKEGVSVKEIATRGDRPMTSEEIEKRRKSKRDGKLTALSIAKSAIGIASLAGIEGYAVFEALKAVHDDGKALSGFQSVEHMIVPMLAIAAVWFVLSLVLRAVSKNAASGVLSDKGGRDANVKQISYLSADLGVCGKTVLIDVIRLVSMIVAGALTLVGIGSVAGTDTAMGVAYGIAVLLIAVGIVGKRLYLFGSDDDDDDTAGIEDSMTYGLAEIQRKIEPVNAVFRPLLAASAAVIVAMSIVTFLPLRTGTQLSDLGTDAWLSFGAIAALALGRCIAVWVPRSAEDVTSFSSFAWSLLLMFGLSAATALFVVGQYVPAAISVALIVLICIGLKILGRGRDSVADLDDYEIE